MKKQVKKRGKTFSNKHYISAYQYSGKKYNFYVNGQTGSISGKRPYSFWKIFFFVLMILSVIIAIVWIAENP